jgi:hypothetical protein
MDLVFCIHVQGAEKRLEKAKTDLGGNSLGLRSLGWFLVYHCGRAELKPVVRNLAERVVLAIRKPVNVWGHIETFDISSSVSGLIVNCFLPFSCRLLLA